MSLERDNERIEALRARNVARTNRFLDARRRTIGLDVDALDHQMQERRARKEREEMVAAEEFIRNENLYKQVALQEADERRLRKEEFTRLRREWLEQTRVKARKEQDEKEFIQLGVDCDACGISSVQKMAGEDPDKTNRTLRQQQQMCAWTEQHSKELRARKDAEDADMSNYWSYLQRLIAKQTELSEEEQATRKALNLTIEEENRRMAAERAEDVAKWKDGEEEANAAELRFRDHFLCKEEVDADGNIPCPQSFRGFTRKQKAEVLQGNAEVCAEMLRRAETEREYEAEWYLHQERMRAVMEQQHQEEHRRMKEAQAELFKERQKQHLQFQERDLMDRHASFGKIDYTHGMYAGFGKSCR
ncbi:unnamed protein product [Ascophyllum nodosum]